MKTSAKKISVIGSGKMGRVIASVFLSGGHEVTVWNRTAAKADDLVSQGAVLSESPGDAIKESDLVIICLFNYGAVRQVLGHFTGDLYGRSVVNLTSGSTEDATSMADWIDEAGANYLDGAMLAVPQTIATPEATILYSGKQEVFDTYHEELSSLAKSHYFGPDAGRAELFDMALLSTSYSTLAGFLHAVSMLDTVQIKPLEFIPLVTPWLNSIVAFLEDVAGEIEKDDYSNGASNIDINHIAVDNLIQTSLNQGISPAIHQPLQALLSRKIKEGGGSDSFSSLFELMKNTKTP